MSKSRASTQETLGSEPKETIVEGKKRKERVKKTIGRVSGRLSMMMEGEEDDDRISHHGHTWSALEGI